MDACSICGSDLHIYHGHGFSEDIGFCVGHEAVGEVVEVGRAVSRVKVGDKVMVPAAVGCGACRSCLAGNVLNCDPAWDRATAFPRGCRACRPKRSACRRRT
jgi:threonine dehydrogenase-like Zn-dependent dehydrogenase